MEVLRKCVICRHPDRQAIEKALLAGETLRNIGVAHGISAASVYRHKAHVIRAMELACNRRDESLGTSLLDKLGRIEFDLQRLAQLAEQRHELPAAIAALKTLKVTSGMVAE